MPGMIFIVTIYWAYGRANLHTTSQVWKKCSLFSTSNLILLPSYRTAGYWEKTWLLNDSI